MPVISKKFDKNFFDNYKYTHSLCPFNLSSWTGSKIFVSLMQENQEKLEEY